MLEIKFSGELLIIATVAGPILAVQAQKWIERATEKRRRKLSVIYVLMATRAARVAPDHVRALNQIDIEFTGAHFLSFIQWQTSRERAIIDAWRIYSDHLNERIEETREVIAEWNRRGDDKFIDLLHSMSQYFRFPFDKVQLRRGVYSPRAHGEAETLQRIIQDNLARLLSGQSALYMNVVGFPFSEEASFLQQNLQKLLLHSLSTEAGIPVKLTNRKDTSGEG